MAKLKLGTHIEPVSANSVQLVDYEPRTIAKIDPEKGQRFAIGKGYTENPIQAEGFLYGIFHDDSGSDDTDGAQITNGQLIAEVTTQSGKQPNMMSNNELASVDLKEIDDSSDMREFARRVASGRDKVAYPFEIRFKIRMEDGQTATFNPDDTQNDLKLDGLFQER